MTINDAQLTAFEETLPRKAGSIAGDERKPIVLTVNAAAAEVDLSALIGQERGAWITFGVRNGTIYIGINKTATSGTTITNGDNSLGYKLRDTDTPKPFWVERSAPFIEVIADAAGAVLHYYRSNPNRSNRKGVSSTT